MKRSVDVDDESAHKRFKQESQTEEDDTGPFRQSLQRKASDLSTTGIDESGFIQAKVVMKWPAIDGHVRAELGVLENGTTQRFEAVFAGICPSFFDSIKLVFQIGDVLQLSLKGVLIVAVPSKPNTLPMKLMYTDGVCLRFVDKKTPPSVGMMVDYWQEREKKEHTWAERATGDAPFQDDWYSTPSVAVLPVGTTDPGEVSKDLPSGQGPALSASDSKSTGSSRTSLVEPKRTSPLPVDGKDDRASIPFVLPNTKECSSSFRASVVSEIKSGSTAAASETSVNPKLSKKAEKAQRRAAQRAARELALLVNASPYQGTPPETVQPRHPQQLIVPDFIEGSSRNPTTSVPQRNTSSAGPIPPPPKGGSQIRRDTKVKTSPGSISRAASPPRDVKDSALQLEAGCTSREGLTYTPLRDLSPSPGRVFNVCAVVAAQTTLSPTRKEEWSRKITLIDPSKVDQDELSLGFNVTCFTKQRRDNVPDAKLGDVLVLRGVLISDWNGSYNGSCPSYKMWSWSLYDPKSGSTTHGGSIAPSYNGSFATSAVPTQLDTTELQYCIRLGDWWSAVLRIHEKKISEAIVVQIGGEGASVSAMPARAVPRLHRLIKDASPSAPPSGYFDCTVEIVHGYRSSDIVYSLFVTDYTTNEGLSAIDANWCPPSLSKMVLRMETWYSGGEYAEQNMKTGDFFLLPNARIKMDANGYLEASISEHLKFQKLDTDELQDWPHLRALLNRKKEWHRQAETAGTHKFPHRLFRDASPQQHFQCTVQLLSVSKKNDRSHIYIYVTDYTSRSDLAPVYFDSDIMRYLDSDLIVKIALFDDQVNVLEELHSGDFLLIKNLRLKPARAGAEGDLAGKLGGNDRLIFKLDPNFSASEDLPGLLERKNDFEIKQRIATAKPARSEKTASETKLLEPSSKQSDVENGAALVTTSKKTLPRTMSIKRLLAHKSCPCKFRIIARIISLWPLHLVDCVGMYCRKCKEDIPPTHKVCTKCIENMLDNTITPTFRFFLQLEDKRGDLLHVSVSQRSSLVSDLEACDMREDSDAFEGFRDRLAPVLGDLLDGEDRVKHGEGSSTPWLDLVVGSWTNEQTGEREHTLLEHALVGVE